MQICDNLSVSAAPSQLPWEGSLGFQRFSFINFSITPFLRKNTSSGTPSR